MSQAARAKRVLIYSHDTYGIGNIRRTLEICHALSEEIAELSILVITGSPYFEGFRKPDNLDIVKLPELKRQDRGQYEARKRGFESDDVWRMRGEICQSAISHFAPDLLMVDKGPFGVADELRQGLELLSVEQPQCIKILALRDILDEPAWVREHFRTTNRAQEIVDHYDRVWVFGHRELFDLTREYGLPPQLESRLSYLGFIGRTETIAPPAEVRARLQVGEEPLLVVTAGGGDDGEQLLTTFAEAMPAVRRRYPDLTNVVVCGPQSSRRTRDTIRRACEADGASLHLDFARDLLSLMSAADAVLCMGGYNTMCEVLMLGKRATIVPRTEPVREQLVRARMLAERGVVRMCEPKDLVPTRIVREVAALFDGWSPNPLDPQLTRFDAHHRAARAAAGLLGNPRVRPAVSAGPLAASSARAL